MLRDEMTLGPHGLSIWLVLINERAGSAAHERLIEVPTVHGGVHKIQKEYFEGVLYNPAFTLFRVVIHQFSKESTSSLFSNASKHACLQSTSELVALDLPTALLCKSI